jgi:hypothetical protein
MFIDKDRLERNSKNETGAFLFITCLIVVLVLGFIVK